MLRVFFARSVRIAARTLDNPYILEVGATLAPPSSALSSPVATRARFVSLARAAVDAKGRGKLKMAGEFTPDEEAFRAAVIKRFGDALRPCLDEAIGKDIREHEAWSIVSAELIKLASLYAIQIGSTADEIAALARDCYNQALQLSREQAGGLN